MIIKKQEIRKSTMMTIQIVITENVNNNDNNDDIVNDNDN